MCSKTLSNTLKSQKEEESRMGAYDFKCLKLWLPFKISPIGLCVEGMVPRNVALCGKVGETLGGRS